MEKIYTCSFLFLVFVEAPQLGTRVLNRKRSEGLSHTVKTFTTVDLLGGNTKLFYNCIKMKSWPSILWFIVCFYTSAHL